jgi:amino-acid N-acetyltransferase
LRPRNGLLLIMRPATLEDLPSVLNLLETAKLPTAGVSDHIQNFRLEFHNNTLLGCAGLEIHGQTGLLRSVMVNTAERSHGIGTKLVNAILQHVKIQQLSTIFLLTESAQNYFPRFGFKQVSRAEIPTNLYASEELRGACPDSAVVMMLEW